MTYMCVCVWGGGGGGGVKTIHKSDTNCNTITQYGSTGIAMALVANFI